AQVLDAFGPGRRLAHTAIDDVGPEPARGLGQHRPYTLLRRAQLVDIEGDIRADRLGQLQALPWSSHHNGAGGASQACQAEGKQPDGATPLHYHRAPEPGLRAAHGMRRYTQLLVQRGNGRTRGDLEHKGRLRRTEIEILAVAAAEWSVLRPGEAITYLQIATASGLVGHTAFITGATAARAGDDPVPHSHLTPEKVQGTARSDGFDDANVLMAQDDGEIGRPLAEIGMRISGTAARQLLSQEYCARRRVRHTKLFNVKRSHRSIQHCRLACCHMRLLWRYCAYARSA